MRPSTLLAALGAVTLLGCEVGLIGGPESLSPSTDGSTQREGDDAGQDASVEFDAGAEADAGADGGDDAGAGLDAGDDAGTSDAGTPDAGELDAGLVDGGEGDAGFDAGLADAGTPFEQFCAALVDAYCTRQETCKRLAPSRRASCLADKQHVHCTPRTDSVARGYRTLDPVAAVECVGEVANLSCDVSISSLCSQALVANADLNRPCLFDADCKNGMACVGTGCSRLCVATGNLNQPCRRSGLSCSQGYCDSAADLCRPPKPVGSSCSSQTECDAYGYCEQDGGVCASLPAIGQGCRSYTPQCAPGAFCSGASPGTCQAQKAIGQPCLRYDECVPSAFCNWAASPYTCQAKRAAGAACLYSNDCQPNLQCLARVCRPLAALGQPCANGGCQDPDQVCDTILRTCQAFTRVDAGAPCTNAAFSCRTFDDVCRGSQYNPDGGVGVMGRCVARALGDSCNSPWDCPPGASCPRDGGPGTCVPASTGSECTSDRHCPALHFCSGGACVPKSIAGQTCLLNDPVDSCTFPTVCQRQADGGGLCGELGDLGSSCLGGYSYQCKAYSQCHSGACASVGRQQEPCISNAVCIVGACVDAGTGRACGPLLADGQPCAYSSACASGRCDRGACAPRCP